jgi:hypothetical protein
MSDSKPAELFLEIFHYGEADANVERAVAAGAAFRRPAIRKPVPSGGGSYLAQELAALHISIIEHFCSIYNAGVTSANGAASGSPCPRACAPV